MLQRFFVVTLLGVVASIRKLGRQETDVGDLGASNFTPTFLKQKQICSSYGQSSVAVRADAADAECQKICFHDPECAGYDVWTESFDRDFTKHVNCYFFKQLQTWRSGFSDWSCYPKKRCYCSSPGNVVCGASTSIPIESCTSSSQHKKKEKYACWKAYDGNYGTDWATHWEGKGSWIRLSFPQTTGVSQVTISQRGYHDRNSRIELTFDDGSRVVKKLNDNAAPNILTFPHVMTRHVVITVLEVFRSKNSGFKEISFGCTGNFNSNEYTCIDGTKAYCASSHYCRSQTFLWGQEACQRRPR